MVVTSEAQITNINGRPVLSCLAEYFIYLLLYRISEPTLTHLALCWRLARPFLCNPIHPVYWSLYKRIMKNGLDSDE